MTDSVKGQNPPIVWLVLVYGLLAIGFGVRAIGNEIWGDDWPTLARTARLATYIGLSFYIPGLMRDRPGPAPLRALFGTYLVLSAGSLIGHMAF